MRSISRILIALFCGLAFAGFALVVATPAQVTFSVKPPPDLASPTNRRITLDIVVTHHSGKPVHGLQQQDFTLLDNKQPQTILSFREAGGSDKAADPPAQAIVLIDAINDVYTHVASQREQLKKFLRQGGGELPLPMSLISFPDKSKDQPVATQDGNALTDTLNSNSPGIRSFSNSQGVWGGVERFQLSIPTLEQLEHFHLLCSVFSAKKEALAIGGRNRVKGGFGRPQQFLFRARSVAAEGLFDLAPHRLDGVEIGRIRRQIKQPRAGGCDGLANSSDFVRR